MARDRELQDMLLRSESAGSRKSSRWSDPADDSSVLGLHRPSSSQSGCSSPVHPATPSSGTRMLSAPPGAERKDREPLPIVQARKSPSAAAMRAAGPSGCQQAQGAHSENKGVSRSAPTFRGQQGQQQTPPGTNDYDE
eukprot:m51a1_g12174 hypothetical protein (138) ;mRNA; r:83-724